MNSNLESFPISALQHWMFCPRQCVLIHVERLWEENRLTAEGRVLHERVDAGQPESHHGNRLLRSVHVGSERLGIHGIADAVEIRAGKIYPVEYKRGLPKSHRADEVQLCAQALCLEEMTGERISEGSLYYGKRKRRTKVSFNDGLRSLTERVAAEMSEALLGQDIPEPDYEPNRCDACSLNDLCRPRSRRSGSSKWLERCISKAAVPE